MADTKITALTALTAADPANDVIPIVDVSDTTMAASGTTKKISVNNILGASGTATLASATITGAATVGTTLGVTGVSTLASAVVTGALTVDTTTLVVDATNNRVGIGIASPIDVFQISSPNPNVYITDSGVGGSDQANLYLGVNTVPTYAGILVDLTNDILNVRHNQATRLSIGSTGNVSVSTGNVVMATSGKGIDFSATTSGSGTMTSELLNDYEEGTWVPTIVGNTIAGVGVYVNQVGTYTKIGNQVTVWVNIEWSAHTGTGTQMYIGGLPFSLRGLAGYNASAALGYITNIALTAGNFPLILAGNSDSFARFYQSPTGGGAATAVPMDTAGQVGFSLSYQV